MTIGTIYGTDSLDVLVTVTDQEFSAPLVLTGATLEVAAKLSSYVVAGEATVVDANAGTVRVFFPAGTFLGKPGAWQAQLRITKGAEVQTVAVLLFTVEQSFVVTP